VILLGHFLLQPLIDAVQPNARTIANESIANACLCFGFFACDFALAVKGQAPLANDGCKQPHVGLNLLPHRFRSTRAGFEAHGVEGTSVDAPGDQAGIAGASSCRPAPPAICRRHAYLHS
jgi:hypothetical protein